MFGALVFMHAKMIRAQLLTHWTKYCKLQLPFVAGQQNLYRNTGLFDSICRECSRAKKELSHCHTLQTRRKYVDFTLLHNFWSQPFVKRTTAKICHNMLITSTYHSNAIARALLSVCKVLGHTFKWVAAPFIWNFDDAISNFLKW